jgi:hypothetical protein
VHQKNRKPSQIAGRRRECFALAENQIEIDLLFAFFFRKMRKTKMAVFSEIRKKCESKKPKRWEDGGVESVEKTEEDRSTGKVEAKGINSGPNGLYLLGLEIHSQKPVISQTRA